MARHFKQQKQVVYSKSKDEAEADKEVIIVEGRVTELLPNAEFSVQLLDPLYGGHIVRAKISGRMRMNNIKIIIGDYVRLELNPYDLARGRITFRHRSKPVANDNPAPSSAAA